MMAAAGPSGGLVCKTAPSSNQAAERRSCAGRCFRGGNLKGRRPRLRRPLRVQAMEHVRILLKRQQVQINALVQHHTQLREETEALRECLEASGNLAPVRFLACLHRRRFAEAIKRIPGPWGGSLDTVIQIRELAVKTAEHAGAASVTPLAAASRALRGGVGTMLSEFPALFPSHVYAVGGMDDLLGTLSSVERFDSSGCAWETVAPMSERRESCAAVAANDLIYVLGGVNATQCLSSVEAFSPRSGTWTRMPPLRCARQAAVAVALAGQIYAIGGRDCFQALDSVERLGSGSDRWELLPALRSARFGAAAAALGGLIYVLGGSGGGRVLDVVECLDLERGLWESLPSLHARRYRAAAAAAHGRVYVAGGCDCSWKNSLRSVERFDPHTRAWSVLPPLQVPRWGAAAVAAGGSVWVLGGRQGGNGSAVASVERFDPATGTWEPMPDLRTPRKFCAAAACRG